jgi:hypothetical protein
LDARTVARLADRIGTDAAVGRLYARFSGVSASPEMTARTLAIYRCAISNVSPAGFLRCLGGVPGPGPPPAPADRRPPAVPAARH